jgi:hypothetical protein
MKDEEQHIDFLEDADSIWSPSWACELYSQHHIGELDRRLIAVAHGTESLGHEMRGVAAHFFNLAFAKVYSG